MVIELVIHGSWLIPGINIEMVTVLDIPSEVVS